MSINIPNVNAPAPTMGPWVRYVNRVLTDLDNKVNPESGLTNTLVKASALTNYTKFADSNAVNNGDVGPYLAADQNPANFPDIFPDHSGAAIIGPARNNLLTSYTIPAVGVTSTSNNSLTPSQVLSCGVVYGVGDILDFSQINRAVILNPNAQTTVSSTNVRIDPISGVLAVVTSLRASKANITDLDPKLVMDLRPVTFTDAKDTSENPSPIVGLIAEEVDAAVEGQHPLASYGSDGTLQGVDYDRVGVAAVAMIQRQQEEIDELKRQVAALIATIGQ